jgi:hypothetical protein
VFLTGRHIHHNIRELQFNSISDTARAHHTRFLAFHFIKHAAVYHGELRGRFVSFKRITALLSCDFEPSELLAPTSQYPAINQLQTSMRSPWGACHPSSRGHDAALAYYNL